MNRSTLSLGVVLGACLCAQATDIDKRSLVPDHASRAFLASTNGIVTVHVGDAASFYPGRFTIGTAAGERLLYGHGLGDPGTSYIRMMVDGTAYSPGSGGNGETPMLLTAGPALVGTSIVTSWEAGGVTLTQTLTPDMVAGQGTIRIEYDLQGDATFHDVSLMLEMDTQVDANDSAPLSTSYGYTAVETCFESGFVPSIWQAFEQDPAQDPSLLVGCGILTGFGATLPDRAAFGQWGAFYGAAFNYVCSGLPYGDSACLLWWEPGTLAPFQSHHYQTYYGTCTVTQSPGELNLSLGGNTALSCEGGQLVPNPFDVNLLITNTGGDSCTAVTATLVPGPGLESAAMVFVGDIAAGEVGAAGFQLTALGSPCDQLLTYTIEVTSADCPTNVISGTVWVPCCRAAGAEDLPVGFGLGAAYPNPFNPVTVVPFTLPETGHAELAVYNTSGDRVAVLHSGMTQRGNHRVSFDASGLPSGVYFARLSCQGATDSRKLVLVK
jgi:hypothetical protein